MWMLAIPALIVLGAVLIIAYRMFFGAPDNGGVVISVASLALVSATDSITAPTIPLVPVLMPGHRHRNVIRLPNPNKVLFRTRNGAALVAKVAADCDGALALYRPGHKSKVFYRSVA